MPTPITDEDKKKIDNIIQDEQYDTKDTAMELYNIISKYSSNKSKLNIKEILFEIMNEKYKQEEIKIFLQYIYYGMSVDDALNILVNPKSKIVKYKSIKDIVILGGILTVIVLGNVYCVYYNKDYYTPLFTFICGGLVFLIRRGK